MSKWENMSCSRWISGKGAVVGLSKPCDAHFGGIKLCLNHECSLRVQKAIGVGSCDNETHLQSWRMWGCFDLHSRANHISCKLAKLCGIWVGCFQEDAPLQPGKALSLTKTCACFNLFVEISFCFIASRCKGHCTGYHGAEFGVQNHLASYR